MPFLRKLLILTSCLVSLQSYATMVYPTMNTELITRSRAIVTAKIISRQDSTYTLLVSGRIKGNTPDTIKLPVLPAYVGYDRWDEQKMGQTEIAFLTKDTTDKNKPVWSLSSRDGSSEILIANDSAYLYGGGNLDTMYFPDANPQLYRIMGSKRFYTEIFSLPEMIQAIRDFDQKKERLSRIVGRIMTAREKHHLRTTSAADTEFYRQTYLDIKSNRFIRRYAISPSHIRLLHELVERQGVLI